MNYRYLQLASILLFSFFFPSEIRAQTNTVTVGSTSYEVGYVTGSYNENISILTNVLSAPWVGDRNLTFLFVRAYEAQVGTSPFSALTSGTDQLVFIYSPSKEVRLTDSGYVLARSPEALAVAQPYRVFAYVISPNSAPTADAGADQTAVASAATVTLDGSGSTDPDSGDTLTYAWSQTAGTTVSLSSTSAAQPTFTAPSLGANDAAVTLTFSLIVTDDKSNASTADTVDITVNPPENPAAEFEAEKEEIQAIITQDASRSLRSSVTANQRMTQSARSRFISARQTKAREEDVTRALIPFDVDGNFTLSESGLSTAGNFFQQVGNEEGTYRRLFFGDFDVPHDNDTDSTTATLTGRMAWEHMTSEQTMLGYFIGGELATSTIGGSFEGDQDHIGVTAGAYVVHELAEQVYFDGFASLGAGRNNLEMVNDTLALESEYTTQTATLGGIITGVYSQKGYDFKPELALSFGKTWLGDIGFTGRAYGLVDNTLSLDAGYVSIASFTFRPEVIIPIGADFVADTNTQLSFAPRLVCEQIKSTTKTSDCGTGGELGFSSTSEDGLSSADMRVLLDRINGGTRSSFVFSVEHKF